MIEHGFYLVTNLRQQEIADFLHTMEGWFCVAETPGLNGEEFERAQNFFIDHKVPNKYHFPVSVWNRVVENIPC